MQAKAVVSVGVCMWHVACMDWNASSLKDSIDHITTPKFPHDQGY